MASGWKNVGMDRLRPGYGLRHPALVVALVGLRPAASQLANWRGLRLRISAYLPLRPVPEMLVTSVRCIVCVGDRIVVTESPDDVNIWPGGRREPGETMRETAVREVYEETGYELDPRSVRPLGFLNHQHLAPPPADYRYPHPDFVQLVFCGTAQDRRTDTWRDSDGYVQRSWLETPARARELDLAAVSLPFLDVVSPTPAAE